jgi:phosphoribosyl-ATP pyrophosphohydrolase
VSRPTSIFPPFNVNVPLPKDTQPPAQEYRPGYHLRPIERGVLGGMSKIMEEAEEAVDADMQGCDVMVLVELSDLYGAIKAYLAKNHPSITMESLALMSSITERAFVNGRR